MASVDSSQNYMRATSTLDAKKANSSGGSECDDTLSVSSSTCGSAMNERYAPKLSNHGIKYRSNNKKTVKNFGSVRSFRRRAKTRLVQSPAARSDDAAASHSDSLVDSSEASPNYLKGTSCSKGKKTPTHSSPRRSESPFDSSDRNGSPILRSTLAYPNSKPLQTLGRTSSFRNVGFLVRKASFKPKRPAVNYPKVSEDVAVGRATYSSAIKDSKFAGPAELRPGETETEDISAMKICRYHHCSLHGHGHGAHDPAPQPRRFLYKKRRSLKKQRSMKPKTESWPGAKHSSDKKKNLSKSQIYATVEPVHQEGIGDCGVENQSAVNSYSEIRGKPEAQCYKDDNDSVPESALIEVAFGETSYPERSYQESLNIMRKFSLEEEDFGGTSFRLNGRCLSCSCHNQEQVTSTTRRTDPDLPRHKSLGKENGYKDEIPLNGFADVLGTSSSDLFKKPKEQASNFVEDNSTFSYVSEAPNKDCPETLVIGDDEVTKKSGVLSSPLDSQTSSCINSDEAGVKPNSTLAGDSKVDVVMQVKNSVTSSPTHNRGKLQFSKQRHISMWHLIHQHMSSNLAAEPAEKPLQGADGENPLDGAHAPPAMESSSSCGDSSGSHVGTMSNEPEIQEIELRKLFAIKLVREAIEKILLPEVQDQASDDQSITSESTAQVELIEKNQNLVLMRENCGDPDDDIGQGNMSSNPKGGSHMTDDTSGPNIKETENETGPEIKETNDASGPEIKVVDDASGPEIKGTDDASGPEIKKNEKKVVNKSEKKAPKHWSNLKKWILLQRFIRALEKVRKFNPRKPQHLPLNPDPEAEKVNLRPQTVDERKNAEEWMLDYALRQAVSQLAPTQKKKVALLVTAFETVVPPQEESQVQFRIPRLNDDSRDVSSNGYKVNESVSEGHGNDKVEAPVNGKAMRASDAKASVFDSTNQENGFRMTRKMEKLYHLNGDSGDSSVKFQCSTGERFGELTSTKKSVFSSTIGTSMDGSPESKEENPVNTAGHHLKGVNKDEKISLKSKYWGSGIIPGNGERKPEDPDSENGDPSSTTQSMILDVNGKSGTPENILGLASHSDAMNLEKNTSDETEREDMVIMQGLQEDAASNFIEGKVEDSGQSNTQSDRKNHIKMWHMIYRHVVSGIAEKVGSQLLDGADDDEMEDNKSPAINNDNHSNDFSKPTDDLNNQRSGFTKSDALKLVKDAVDEILLPDIQDDSSDTQSVIGESISEQDISERNFSEVGGQNMSGEGEILMNEEGKRSSLGIISQKEDGKKELQANKKPELPKPKNWSKLKKLILLKRFVKALEKARNLKTQPHQLLRRMPDPKPEKIDLRSQMMDERKKAEQWMLDYAVQHIVTTLTPTRKRRVSMLVEAFEAVVPFPES